MFHNIASKYTTFVAIDERKVAATSSLVAEVIPNILSSKSESQSSLPPPPPPSAPRSVPMPPGPPSPLVKKITKERKKMDDRAMAKKSIHSKARPYRRRGCEEEYDDIHIADGTSCLTY